MRKNSRAYKIYEAGLAELDNIPNEQYAEYLKVAAAMIAEATKPKAKKEKKPLLYNEHDVLKQLNYDLAVARHGSLNRQLGTMALKETDLEQFRLWFEEVMYPWLHNKNIELTYSMLTRKYPEWLEKARQHRSASPTSIHEAWR